MKTKIVVVMTLISLLKLEITVCSPTPARSTSMSGDQSENHPLTFNIDPDVSGLACGRHLLANINVKTAATDPSTTSSGCNNIRNYLIGANAKGSTDVDLIFTCPGQTHNDGQGNRDVKVVLHTDSDFDTTKEMVPADLTVKSEVDRVLVQTQVEVGIKKTGNSELLWQFIYCY